MLAMEKFSSIFWLKATFNNFMGFSLNFHSIKIKSKNFICLTNKMNTSDHLWMVHKFLVKMQVKEIRINLQNNFIPLWLNGAFRSIAFQVQNGYQSIFLVLKIMILQDVQNLFKYFFDRKVIFLRGPRIG